MTPEQYRVWQGALRLGRADGIGPTWTAVEATGGTISTAPIFSVAGTVRGYAIRNNRDSAKTSLPQIPIFTAEWVFILIEGTVESGFVLQTATRAFLIIGEPSTDQGWTLAPLAPCALVEVTGGDSLAGYATGFDWPFTYAE